ncbi:MAG: ribosome biogenesis GTPase Der [Deltaproteobacteria bacterium]|nr:ribosome biogenesis GTPase Der [Deltaproteobacteria bacterium]
MKPIVAIVGRPNVGKSALFNRLLGRRRAITWDEPGVTRDSNYADCEEGGSAFTLVDTGGFEPAAKEGIFKKVKEQARLAIEEADVILFLMDGRVGPMAGDKEFVKTLRKTGKKVIYAANKIDSKKLVSLTSEFYPLGVGDVLPVSAEHGLGINELLDCILENLPVSPPAPEHEEEEEKDEEGKKEEERVKVAIVGRPNAGKSSLLNKLIGKERAITSEVPGTTRDSIDTPFAKNGKSYLFIDTAGIRKKKSISRVLDIYCTMEAIKSIERSDVALLVLDGVEGLKGQDEKIAGLIEKKGKPCIIIVNKWDIVKKDMNTARTCTERIRSMMPFLSHAPVILTSALTGRNVGEIFGAVDTLFAEAGTKVPTSKLNQLLRGFVSQYRSPVYRGKEVKLYYTTQTGSFPPAFTVFTNLPDGVTESYRRYLVNSFRQSLGLNDVPVRVVFRGRR